MKLINHDAAVSDRRGSCPRNPWLVFLLAAFFALAGLAPAWADNPLVPPISNPDGNGNPSCTALGYDFGFKPQFGDGDANWDGGFPASYDIPGGKITILRADGFPLSNAHVGFESTVPVAGFIVKGGPNAYWYDYDGNGLNNVLFDTNLTVPDHPGPGLKPDISHIEVCLNYRLVVDKTAAGTFDRTYEWEIDKSVTPDAADIFFNDSQAFDYTIDVTYIGSDDSNFAVSGTITISNPFPGIDATNLSVTDMLNDGTVADVDCDDLTTVAGGASIECSYTASPIDANATLNTATATYTMAGAPRSSSGTADVSWTRTDIDGTVNITDQFDGGTVESLGPCSFDDEQACAFTDTRILDCSDFAITTSGGSGSKSNTATIVETNDSASATVTLTCYAPSVTKTAVPAFTREYSWTVTKALEGDDPPLLSEGQSYELVYTIDVNLDVPAYTDSAYGVSGSITVDNPAPIAAVVNSVTDVFTGGSDIMVDCDGDAPFTIAAGGSLDCTYSGDSDGTAGTNTATAVQQNYARAANGTATVFGTTDYSGTADFAFVTPTDLINACADVYDLLSVNSIEVDTELLIQAGFDPEKASVCFDDELPAGFSYSIEEAWFAVRDAMAEPPICELLVDNTAVVVEFDRLAIDPMVLASDSVQTTLLNANCTPEGCTLTQGYWKTHSAYGPAPYDDNWARVGNTDDAGWNALDLPDVCTGDQCGEDTPFFGGDTWYNVFWTPPAGNVYYNLAHQYMAATLNVLNGATMPAHVFDAWQEATTLFGRCGAEDFARTTRGRWGLPGGKCEDDRGFANELAGLLDSYNNGYEGVLHCSDIEYDD